MKSKNKELQVITFLSLFLIGNATNNSSVAYHETVSSLSFHTPSTSASQQLNSTPAWNLNGTNLTYILPSGIMSVMTSTISTKIDKCYSKNRWRQDVFTDGKECLTDECMKSFFEELTFYMNCNSREVSDELQLIGSHANQYALLVADKKVREISFDTTLDKVKNSQSKDEGYFTIEYGFIVKSFQEPHIALEFSLEKNGKAKIFYPPAQLVVENNAFIFTEFNSVYTLDREIKYYHTSTAIDTASKYLRASRFITDKKFFNSKIISFATSPEQTNPSDYITIKFLLNNYENLTLTNHLCVHIKSLGAGFWTNGECHEHYYDKTEIICRCKALSGSYAVISELEKEVPEEEGIKRSIISLLIMGVSIAGIVAMVFSILYPFIMKASHLGGMLLIYRMSDLTLAVECAVLLIGVIKSDDVEKTPLIGAALHYFQATVMVWTIVEGFYLYHGILPLFQNTTGLLFFFSTVSYGFAAALAGGALGYPFGYSDKKEFIWPTGDMATSDAIYMFVPSLLCLCVLIVFDVILIYELLSWIGNKDDYSYARSVKFLKRANGYMFVFAVTQFFGVSSQASVSDGFYTYGFVGFFAIQLICMFYNHCISNFEILSYREEENDEAKNSSLDNGNTLEANEDPIKEKRKSIDDLLLSAPIIENNLPPKQTTDDGEENQTYEEDGLDGRDGLDGHQSPVSTTDSQVALIKSRPVSANTGSLYGSKATLISNERPNETIVDIPEGVKSDGDENADASETVDENEDSSNKASEESEENTIKNEVDNDDDDESKLIEKGEVDKDVDTKNVDIA